MRQTFEELLILGALNLWQVYSSATSLSRPSIGDFLPPSGERLHNGWADPDFVFKAAHSLLEQSLFEAGKSRKQQTRPQAGETQGL